MKKFIKLVLIATVLIQTSLWAQVSDPALEKRLDQEKRYLTKKGDTWKRIAYKVYGHSSWWERLQKRNIDLSNFPEDKILPTGVEIWYRAPQINRKYTVQKNDTFTRILEWKYGATSEWIKILRLNRNNMKRYSDISPGDQFEFLYSGRVVLTKKEFIGKSSAKVKEENKVYKTVQGDTLRLVAYRVYGHKSWWPKLVERNPKLKGYSRYYRLPVGMKLAYKGPVVGHSYKVRPGDTLSRIALWKYGNFKLWDRIARLNKELLRDPDLIRVGDRIVLKGLGEISIYKKPGQQMEKSAPIVLKTPVTESKVVAPVVDKPKVIKPVAKKIELPKPVVKVAEKPSAWKAFFGKLARFVPIVIFIVVIIAVVLMLIKVSKDIIDKKRAAADKAFADKLTSQKPVSAQNRGPKLFNKLKAVTDDGEYSDKIDYPTISKRVKSEGIFKSRGH